LTAGDVDPEDFVVRVPDDALRIDGADGTGVHQCRPILFLFADGSVRVKPESTFFPDAWSDLDVRAAVTEAWHDPLGRRDSDGRWTGVGRSLRVHGWYDRASMRPLTAYPAL
jgi:Bacterial EndoU nuclease